MTLLIAFACLAFSLLLIKVFDLFAHAEQIITAAKKAGEIEKDTTLDDLAREKQTQQQALILLKLFVRVFFESTIAFFGPVAVVYGLSLLGVVDFAQLVGVLVSWPFMIGFALVMVISWSNRRSG